MSPHDYIENLMFDNHKDLPTVLPHHLFMLAAVTASKETGLYPLTGMESSKQKKENRPPHLNNSRPKSPEDLSNGSQGKGEEEEHQKEVRQIIHMTCTVKNTDDGKHLSLLVRLEDKMNRQMSCKVGENETAMDLANELVHYGLISEVDRDKVAAKMEEQLNPPE